MIETVFDSSNNYNQHIEFYNNAKGMFRWAIKTSKN
jgi:hypothetical protein